MELGIWIQRLNARLELLASGKIRNERRYIFFEDLCCKFRGTMPVGGYYFYPGSECQRPTLPTYIPTMLTIHKIIDVGI